MPRRATEIMALLELRHWKSFQKNYLQPLLEAGIIERTIPDKPTSSKQRYQPGPKGKILLENLQPGQS
jgi:predicted transcriptional regulator